MIRHMLRQNGALTNYLFMNNRYTHFKSGESIIVLSPDLKESSKYTQSLNSSILSQSSKDFLEMRIAQPMRMVLNSPEFTKRYAVDFAIPRIAAISSTV